MKKQYTKPYLGIERFSLTQSVADNCGVNQNTSTLGVPTTGDKTVCGWYVGGITVFANGVEGCFLKIGENDSYAGYCYDNPNGGVSIFNSF